MQHKSYHSSVFGFVIGILFTTWLLSNRGSQTPTVSTSSTTSTTSQAVKSTTLASVKFPIDNTNIARFYDEYYKYYELNKEWMKKSFLGVHFLQNPNDAITIAEILHDQNIDLVIETGSYRGAAALFFASIMYQYRYNASEKSIRPFRIVTMDINPEAQTYIDRYPLLARYITFIPHASVSEKAKSIVNRTFTELKPSNVFISLDGDHYAQAVYEELLYYQQYALNIGNYILVQDTRLSSKWHTLYCSASKYDGPCNGPHEGLNWFLKNEGQGRFAIDHGKEYLFSTHHKGWVKRTA
ncbi:unnamed protein product [Adineta ricciae]|uniref:Rhamnosyl O-methyltransferase n=1 Tax=Adineta ricciae TaxID=249248 RepID=A0A814WBV3_ADIRI|nr:unnamed protein product [Adineta ricciae]